jgi:hypothetical protein
LFRLSARIDENGRTVRQGLIKVFETIGREPIKEVTKTAPWPHNSSGEREPAAPALPWDGICAS